MIDKRLFQLTEKKNLILIIVARLGNLGLSILMWLVIAQQLTLFLQKQQMNTMLLICVLILVLLLKSFLTKWLEGLTYSASSELRVAMRSKIMDKAFRLGQGQGQLPSATLAQLSVDGIEQLEIYYARFLPQLFYCLLASLAIFAALVSFAWKPALVLLLCMPLIPIVIMAVMKIAQRILSNYWSQYTDLGAKFHENLSGLSTLKAYDQDEAKQAEGAEDAENFHKVTMSLLSMQLNSITIMDIVSYCGAALGIGLALFAFQQQEISIMGVLMFVLLSAEFFIPMRQLGSLFHVAMNGISACRELFNYLELPEQSFGEEILTAPLEKIKVEHVNFAYQTKDTANSDKVLENVSFTVKQGEFTALVGKSGSGKSTVARLLLHQLFQYEGDIYWNDTELKQLDKKTVYQSTALVDNHGYLYPTSIKENLMLADSHLMDEELWEVLEKVQLKSFVEQLPHQLKEPLDENGENLSGGQRQRLLLARAILRNADFYVFDEITSGVDLRSEEIILQCLQELAKTKVVIFISHRLYNVLSADKVIVFEAGKITAVGSPTQLLEESAYFQDYFSQEREVLAGGEGQ